MAPRKDFDMPVFRVLMRVDAYVTYEADIEAQSAEEASDIGYGNGPEVTWRELDTIQFDARHVVTLDGEGNEIEETRWGEG
jgi:hypothetical protein